MTIKENVATILNELPEDVQLVAAAKAVAPARILEAIEAGVKIIGENYIKDAEAALEVVGEKVEWHFIGHLQSNKVKKAVRLFDMIETIDSTHIAREVDFQLAARFAHIRVHLKRLQVCIGQHVVRCVLKAEARFAEALIWRFRRAGDAESRIMRVRCLCHIM